MPEVRETVLEINLEALKHNYDFLRSRLRPDTRFMAVVKAFGYGSDALVIAKKLEELGIDYFAVAYVHEGVALRESGVSIPILVLHPQIGNLDLLITYDLEPSLYSLKVLRAFVIAAGRQGLMDYPVHLKFNTGLNRLGFWENDIDFIKKELAGHREVNVKGIFSHLAASDDLQEQDFTQTQIDTFEKISSEIAGILGYTPLEHLLNTSGILNFPEAQHDMVRSGIGLYGYSNDPEIDTQLKSVATLKTVISQLHKIEPGESVGYNRAYISEGYRTTATLPLGHADGIGRQYGMGKGKVLLHGQKAPIVGNVCMDMIMIDVTGIDCQEGDEVIIFGPDNSAEDFAAEAQTISYELITGISSRVKREFKGI